MRVLFAPSIPWAPQQKSFVAGEGPDPLKLYRLLSQRGISCQFADPFGAPWNLFAGQAPFLQSLDPLRGLQIALFKRDVDVVVSVFEGAATSVGTLRPLLGLKAKLAMWDIGLTEWRLREAIINYTLPRTDSLFVLGGNQVEHIRARYKTGRCDISAIGHYIDSEFYSPPPADTDEGYVLSVGDDSGRDFKTLVEAVRPLQTRLVLKTRNAPPELNTDQVEVIAGRLSFLDLRSLYCGSSVVVIPTHITYNASGVSALLEAAACGQAMVVTDNPGLEDFIIPGETCLVVPPYDPLAMREAIHRLMADKALRRRLGANARAEVEARFTCDSFADRMALALQQL